MKTNQTASAPYHPSRFIPGVKTDGREPRLFYAPMKTPREYEDEILEISLPSTDLQTCIYMNQRGGITISQIGADDVESFVSIHTQTRLKAVVASLLELSTKTTWEPES